ncbi:MAG: hypothetical protein DI536_13245 [Archangium gephyra]|uniref:Uncharacterized protein n=1 Tax=Archangium gephyra TaxID=48 RepID=A0A2W5TKG6_9BACT|nr:MAG: hypothetical protein DI536_13245 [Archangium gephyra]
MAAMATCFVTLLVHGVSRDALLLRLHRSGVDVNFMHAGLHVHEPYASADAQTQAQLARHYGFVSTSLKAVVFSSVVAAPALAAAIILK